MIDIEREPIAEAYRQQNRAALSDAVQRGEWTQAEADQAHAVFMKSDMLQTLITQDLQALQAWLKGEVH